MRGGQDLIEIAQISADEAKALFARYDMVAYSDGTPKPPPQSL